MLIEMSYLKFSRRREVLCKSYMIALEIDWGYGSGDVEQLVKFQIELLKNIYYYSDVIMNAMASQITGPWIVYPTVCSGAEQRKHRSSASMAFVRGIHRWPVNSSHKGLVTRKNISIWWRHHVYSTFTVSVLKRLYAMGFPVLVRCQIHTELGSGI